MERENIENKLSPCNDFKVEGIFEISDLCGGKIMIEYQKIYSIYRIFIFSGVIV